MDNFHLMVVANIKRYFTEYGFHEIVLTPYYLYMWTLEWAIYFHEMMKNHLVLSALVVFAIVGVRTALREKESVEEGVLTFVNVYNPNRTRFNWVKGIFWMVFAPYYPLYFWATKGTVYLIVAYMLPYFLLRALVERHYLSKTPEHLTAKERYERI